MDESPVPVFSIWNKGRFEFSSLSICNKVSGEVRPIPTSPFVVITNSLQSTVLLLQILNLSKSELSIPIAQFAPLSILKYIDESPVPPCSILTGASSSILLVS